jgi:predicted  nucleic acid-binding Zn-ribbon protein
VSAELNNLPKYYQLIERVKKMISILETISHQKKELEKENSQLKLNNQNQIQTFTEKLGELETEIKQLKKENKILKEKERTIKTKIDRLAVKLNQFQI